MSMKYFNTPGNDPLYSGTTVRTPSAARITRWKRLEADGLCGVRPRREELLREAARSSSCTGSLAGVQHLLDGVGDGQGPRSRTVGPEMTAIMANGSRLQE